MIHKLTLAFVATTALATASTAELRDTARKLSDSHKEAIVWLSVLAKTTMGADGEMPPQMKAALAAQEKEEKSEVTGTIIDASGMIVTALGAFDKSSMMNGQTVNTQVGEIKLKASSEIKEIKVIMADGSEIPADLVLKDEDLGLAFIKVRSDSDEAKGVEFSAIDLNDSAQGELLDECISLGRLGETFNREPSLLTSEVTGLTVRPRRFYRVSTDSIGSPVFLANGKLLGISVLRNPKRSAGRGGQIQIAPVILPAADIAKIATQARDVEPTEPTAEDDQTPDI